MLRFYETKISKGKFYAATKPIKIWEINIYNIIISKFKQKLILSLSLDI